MKKLFITSVVCLTLSNLSFANNSEKITIKASNLFKQSGTLYIGIYDNESNFMGNKDAVAKTALPVSNVDSINVDFDIQEGNYSVSMYLDTNNNERIDFNAQGIPTEPYGFSGKPAMYGPPSFSDANVTLSKDALTVVKMR